MLRQLNLKMEAIMVNLDKLAADVAAHRNVTDSVLTLVSGLAAKLKELSAGTTDLATQAQIDALAANQETDTARLTEAVTANTPVA
jgi:hypothetical protein